MEVEGAITVYNLLLRCYCMLISYVQAREHIFQMAQNM